MEDPKLLTAFNNIRNSIFPINVIATMSSGKSTLINALLEQKLMPFKNEACTATITEILDDDESIYKAIVFDQDGNRIESIDELTYEIMDRLNGDENVSRINVKGNIPFLDSNSTALCLVDTPGPNNSQNQEHKNTTYSAINADSNNLILYVLNATQLGTNDDDNLLNYVAAQIKKGGKQARDRFLFVINKMDAFNPEEEDIGKAVESARKYLARHGIDDPQLFPCSARTALNISTYLKDIDLDNLTRAEEKALPSAAKETLPIIDKFIEYDSMHLEKYSTLSPSAQKTLEFKLKKAVDAGNTQEQALIHCGIYSIEAAITAYVKKYAKTKKVKDLVESFQEVLDSNQVLVKAKTKVATDEEAAAECAHRAEVVREKIANGAEAEAFKKKVTDLNPMPVINKKADALSDIAEKKIIHIFDFYGETITNREEAKRLINQFASISSDAIAELSAELESVINTEVIDTGKKLLEGYQEKLLAIDEASGEQTIDFSTADLIKGALTNMRENALTWASDEFISETVDDYGETTVEEKVYYEKVGEQEEQVVVGYHQEKVGTKKVKVGSHKEKVGTKSVKNYNRKFFQFWKPKYVDEDVYEEVDDYKDEDVYQTVTDYDTVIKDVFAERTETVEKYSVDVSDIQTGLLSQYRADLDRGIDSAKKYAKEQIKDMKDQFMIMFDELDKLINEKYAELDRAANDQKAKEKELENNKKILAWMHTFITGSTGSGKSNAVYHLIDEIQKKHIPFLVIEPAKGEYRNVFKEANCYGTNPYLGELLQLNPFAFPTKIQVLEHIDRLVEIFNVCWPMYAAMPAVLKESIERAYKSSGWDLKKSKNVVSSDLFPTFSDVLRELNITIKESEYSQDTKGDYIGSLSTRLKSLTNGINGEIFTSSEMDLKKLFEENTIVDISHVGAMETKALIMGIIVLKLQEYRVANATQMNNPLKHITVLEEAHNILKKTSTEQSQESSNMVGKSVEMLTNTIAEIRTYGEGFVIVDQAPNLLDTAVLRNTNTKIVFRLPEEDDRQITGKAMALSDDQIREMAKLETGVATVYQNDWQEAVLCKLPYYESDNAIIQEDKDYSNTENEQKDSILHILLADNIEEINEAEVSSKIVQLALPGKVRKDLIQNYKKRNLIYEWAMADFISNMYDISFAFRGTNRHTWENLGQLSQLVMDNIKNEFIGFEDNELLKIMYFICRSMHEKHPDNKTIEDLRQNYLKWEVK